MPPKVTDIAGISKILDRIALNITNLGYKAIYVGIPQSQAARPGEGSKINNAYLGYIHERGSGEKGIPARPFLAPGVDKALPQVLMILEKASSDAAVLSSKSVDFDIEKPLEAAAQVAENHVKRIFEENNWEPNLPATKRAKNKRHRRDPDSEVRPLIDTGALRKSITSLVADAGTLEES